MPSTIECLLEDAGLGPSEVVPWGQVVPSQTPGVYLVSCSRDASTSAATRAECPLSLARVQELLRARPELRMDGTRPEAGELARRLSGSWMPDEVILYIGKSDQPLRKRVDQYYHTPLGAGRPHAGGWFLKTLADLNRLWVHYVECDRTEYHENLLLCGFMERVSSSTRRTLYDPRLPLPFANLQVKLETSLVRKHHGITGARERN